MNRKREILNLKEQVEPLISIVHSQNRKREILNLKEQVELLISIVHSQQEDINNLHKTFGKYFLEFEELSSVMKQLDKSNKALLSYISKKKPCCKKQVKSHSTK